MSTEMSKDELNLEENTIAKTEEISVPADPFAAFANPEIRTKEDLEGDKKKKKRILLISLISVFVLLAAVIVLLVFVFPKEVEETPEDTATDTSVVLFDKTNADGSNAIASAVFKSKDDTVEIVSKDGKLYAKGYEDLTAHAINIKDLQTLLTKMTALESIGTVSTLADFGLDKPQLTATITYNDGSKKVLEIGNMSPDQAGYYIREQDSMELYILDINDFAILSMDSLDYISTTVFSEPVIESSEEAETDVVLRKMTLGGTAQNGKDFSFRLVTSEDDETFIYYSYIITEPYLKGSNSAYDTDLDAFTTLTASSVIATHPTAEKLKEYGLDNPYSILTFTLAKRTSISGDDGSGNTVSVTTHDDLIEHTLRLSKANSDYYYAMIDDKPIIYLVPVADIPFATMQYDDFADTLLFLEDITQMGMFKVKSPEKETVFELEHFDNITDTAKNLVVTVGDKTYDTMDFRYLVNNFMDIKRHSALTKEVDGLPLKLEIGIYHREKNEPTLTVKFYEVSSNLYAAVLSNGEKYQVKASKVNFVIEQYENYLNGKTVLR